MAERIPGARFVSVPRGGHALTHLDPGARRSDADFLGDLDAVTIRFVAGLGAAVRLGGSPRPDGPGGCNASRSANVRVTTERRRSISRPVARRRVLGGPALVPASLRHAMGLSFQCPYRASAQLGRQIREPKGYLVHDPTGL